MRKIIYEVGKDGYTTLCNSLASVHAMLEQDSSYKVRTILKDIPREKADMSPIRKAMLEQFGYVSPSLKDKVVL